MLRPQVLRFFFACKEVRLNKCFLYIVLKIEAMALKNGNQNWTNHTKNCQEIEPMTAIHITLAAVSTHFKWNIFAHIFNTHFAVLLPYVYKCTILCAQI